MSPRAAPTRDDATAHRFLAAAAVLIDQGFSPSPVRGRHPANTMHFPAALDWLRIEDVIAQAEQGGAGAASRKAFHNRWKDKDSFLRDAVVHALLYRDNPAADPSPYAEQFAQVAQNHSASSAILEFSDAFVEALAQNPRSFLLIHLGAVLDQHNEMHRTVVERIQVSREAWYGGYFELLSRWGLALRPGWTVERFVMALQTMVDGFLLRSRIEPDSLNRCRWEGASLFADSIIALTLGVIDVDRTESTTREALDALIEAKAMSRDS
jgi:hypothetical protein